MSAGINHLHCLEPGLLALGYLNASNSFDPSLALASYERGASVKVLSDLRDPVCMCEQMDAPHHRFTTHYIKPWYALDLPCTSCVGAAAPGSGSQAHRCEHN